MTSFILRRKLVGRNTNFITDEYPDLAIHRNDKALPKALANAKFVVRWGTTSEIPEGAKALNTSKAITETSYKGNFRKKVSDAGYAPKTWTDYNEFIRSIGFGQDFAVVVRPIFHRRSQDLYICTNVGEVRAAIMECGPEYYISEYIDKNREFRVFIAQGRVLVVIEKHPADKDLVSWGCVEEGAFEYMYWKDWPLHVMEAAIKSFNISKLHFAAVDMIEKDGKAYFLEANTAPELTPYYGQCMGKALRYMIEVNSGRIECKKFKHYHDVIHPCMSEKAIV